MTGRCMGYAVNPVFVSASLRVRVRSSLPCTFCGGALFFHTPVDPATVGRKGLYGRTRTCAPYALFVLDTNPPFLVYVYNTLIRSPCPGSGCDKPICPMLCGAHRCQIWCGRCHCNMPCRRHSPLSLFRVVFSWWPCMLLSSIHLSCRQGEFLETWAR